jgi:hypothetical protein
MSPRWRAMYLKCHRREKDGKEQLYWSFAEKRRLVDGRIVDRHVLHLARSTMLRSSRASVTDQ